MGEAAKFSNLEFLAGLTDARFDTLEAAVEAIEVPTKVSELDNDSNFQTAEQVETAVAAVAAGKMTAVKVDSVDAIDLTADDADRHIYLVPNGEDDGDDICDEYLVINGALEKIGTTRVDLSGLVEKVEGKGLSTNDYTNEDKAKLDEIEFLDDATAKARLRTAFGITEIEGE